MRPPGAASPSAKLIPEDEIPLAVMAGRIKMFGENISTIVPGGLITFVALGDHFAGPKTAMAKVVSGHSTGHCGKFHSDICVGLCETCARKYLSQTQTHSILSA